MTAIKDLNELSHKVNMDIKEQLKAFSDGSKDRLALMHDIIIKHIPKSPRKLLELAMGCSWLATKTPAVYVPEDDHSPIGVIGGNLYEELFQMAKYVLDRLEDQKKREAIDNE